MWREHYDRMLDRHPFWLDIWCYRIIIGIVVVLFVIELLRGKPIWQH